MDAVEQVRIEDASRDIGHERQHEYTSEGEIRWRFVGLVFALSVLTLLVLNYPALKSPMIYDSQGFILAKSELFQRHNIWDVISITPIRPLFMVTLYVNYLTTGMDPLYFRLVNIALVAGAGTVLALMIYLILELGVPENRCSSSKRLGVSLFLGFVFAIHPLQTLASLYIWQREAILACFFYFSTVAVYLATRSGRYRNSTIGYGLTGALFFAGMLCKENVVTVPAVLLLAEAILFRGNLKELGRSALRIGALVIVSLILYFVATHSFGGSESRELHRVVKRLTLYYESAGLSFTDVLLTESRAFFAYLATILFPIPGTIALLKAMTISRSLLSPPVTLAACAGVAGVIALGIYLIRRRPVAAFGIFFFTISLIPESILIPPYLFCGYRAILPMAGVLMIAGEVMLRVLEGGRADSRIRGSNIVLGAGSALAVAGLLAVTHLQAVSWNPFSFWKEAYEKLPPERSSIEKKPYLDIVSNLAGLLERRGDISGAENLSREALAMYPDALDLHDILGVALLHRGRVREAIAEFRKALELQPESVGAFNNLGNALLAANKIPEAIEAYRKAIKLKPARMQPYVNLGAAYVKSGQYENARKVLQKAVSLDPRHAKARTNLGVTLIDLGLFSEAIKQLNTAVRLDPRLAIAHFQLGIAWDRTGDTARAVKSYERTLRLMPTFLDARIHLARALAKIHRYSESIDQYQRILQVEPRSYRIHNDVAHLFIMTSQFDKAIAHCRAALSLKPDFAEARANLKLAIEHAGTAGKDTR